MMDTNHAAWINARRTPFEIKKAPIGVPGDNQILVRNRAIAINPVDGKMQALDVFPLNFPDILGQDIAGEVVAIGPNVTRFKIGDRVLGSPQGWETKRNEEKGFQTYTILEVDSTAQIPDTLPFEQATVMPLGIATASAGLFNPDMLALQLPTQPARPPSGKVVLVWGGASCVGCMAIQLCIAAGYEVVTTASTKNFALVKSIGASHVADYHDGGAAVAELLGATMGRDIAGVYDAVGLDAYKHCVDFARQSNGFRFVATVLVKIPDERPDGVQSKWVYAPSIRRNHVSTAIFEDFLPEALKAGTFVSAPPPLVAGTGLSNVQKAVDMKMKGVSARKVVVLL
ncbi:oxidoreductase [Xylariales sp. PMI_506]|nr:oxidoreductase [Xylariales sp. PMI_506]